MSGAPPPRSDPGDRPRGNPAVASTFATAGFLAGLVALWGFTSLFANRDVIDYPDAGPLVGPSMAVAACVVVFLLTLRAKITPPALLGLVAGVVTYVGAPFVGAVAYSLRLDSFSVWWPAIVHFGIGPFVIGAAILAGLVVGATAWLVRPRYATDAA
jgi:hypothetical protein